MDNGFHVVYKNLNEEIRQQIFDLWIRNNVMSVVDMAERIDQVVVVKSADQKIVGVTSVYTHQFDTLGGLYYFFRLYVDPLHRDRVISRTQPGFSSMTRDYLKTLVTSPMPKGIVIAAENPKISSKLMTALGWNFLGLSNHEKRPIWYVNFDGSLAS